MQKKLIFSLVILSFLILQPLTLLGPDYFFSSTDQQEQNNQLLINNKISSEEETIDTFDVNPKSGRWDVIDTNSEDIIYDSNLKVINSANSTSDSSYFAQRGLVKSDSKVEYRAKSSVSGNTSEYFRDQLGEEMTFDSSTQGWVAEYGSSVVSQSNGKLKTVFSAINSGVSKIITNKFSKNVFTNISFDAYCSVASAITIYVRYDDSNTYGSYSYPLSCITSETNYNIFFTSFSSVTPIEKILVGQILFYITSPSSSTFYLDNIKLLGGYDYFTAVNGAVEDTIDFEESKEWSYNVLGNISDFEDSSFEQINSGWTNSVANGWLTVYGASTTLSFATHFNETIVSATYKYFTMEFYSETILSNIQVWDLDPSFGNLVCTDSTGWLASTKYLFSCNLGLDADWTGTESYLYLSITGTANLNVSFNMFYLYDSSLGDVEGFTTNNKANMYVDPSGELINHIVIGAGTNAYIQKAGLSIDTSIFTYFTIRAKSDSNSNRYVSFYSAGYLVTQLLSNSFQTFTFDLSQSSYWIGTITNFLIVFSNTTSHAQNTVNSIFTIDYMLLTADAPTSQEPFIIGFWDQDNSQSLVNITQSFINTTYARFEVEIFDSGLTTTAYYYSDYFSLSDVYYRGKITYNIQKSLLQVEILSDGQTRLFKISYPGDFTISSQTNAFFSLGKAPDIFFDARADFIGSSETWLDFINVNFKEREWSHINAPNSSHVLTDTWNNFRVEDDIESTNTSTWQLNAPFLDYITLDFFTNSTNNANIAAGDEVIFSTRIYNADSITGTLYEIFDFNIGYRAATSTPGDLEIQVDESSIVIEQFGPYTSTNINEMSPGYSLSVNAERDRSNVNFQMRVYPNFNDKGIFKDYSGNLSLSSVNTGFSNEFVIEMEYSIVALYGNVELYASYPLFSKVVREIFQDMVQGINNIGGTVVSGIGNIFSGFINWLGEIFKSLFFMLANIFKVALDALGVIVNSVGSAITSALSALQGALGAYLSQIQTYLGTLATDISNSLSSFFTDLGNLIEFIGDYVWIAVLAGLSDLVDGLGAIFGIIIDKILVPTLNFVISVFGIIIEGLIDLIWSAWDYLYTALIVPVIGTDASDFLIGVANTDWVTVFSTVIRTVVWIYTIGLQGAFLILLAFLFMIPFMKSNGDTALGAAYMFDQAKSTVNFFTIPIPFILILLSVFVTLVIYGFIPNLLTMFGL